MTAPMTTVTDIFGSRMTSRQTPQPAPSTGSMPGKVRMRAGFCAMCAAANRMKPYLAISEGCTVTGPRPSQRVAP